MPVRQHADCADALRSALAARGIDATVSTAPPLTQGPYTLAPFFCPHKVAHWVEPTGEQIARWAREDTP